MRTYEEVQRQRVEYFVKEMEEIVVHTSLGSSLQTVSSNIKWLAKRCVDLLMFKMDNRTKLDVMRAVESRHPEWFEK